MFLLWKLSWPMLSQPLSYAYETQLTFNHKNYRRCFFFLSLWLWIYTSYSSETNKLSPIPKSKKTTISLKHCSPVLPQRLTSDVILFRASLFEKLLMWSSANIHNLYWVLFFLCEPSNLSFVLITLYCPCRIRWRNNCFGPCACAAPWWGENICLEE